MAFQVLIVRELNQLLKHPRFFKYFFKSCNSKKRQKKSKTVQVPRCPRRMRRFVWSPKLGTEEELYNVLADILVDVMGNGLPQESVAALRGRPLGG